MKEFRFNGFSAGFFQFLSALGENNSKEWLDLHRREYHEQVLATVKSFVAEIGPFLKMLNEDFETEPRVGRTISRINNDLRFNRSRPPYRPYIYAGFAQRGRKWSTDALVYVGLYSHGVSVGFYPGGYKQPRVGHLQQAIKNDLRLFQRYLDERGIAESYWEIAGEEAGAVTKWPLPKTARRWMNLENFTVGEYFPATNLAVARRTFLNCAQEIFLDLYPLWLFATSENVREDFELYLENSPALARLLARSASRKQKVAGR